MLLLLSVIAKGLSEKWNLNPLQAGAMAGFIFAGILIGTAAGGFACDRYGRRKPILVTYIGISLALTTMITAPGLGMVLVSQFLLGFFLGVGVPASNAIVAESCPPTHRSNIYCMTMVLFALGQLYSASIVWMTSPSMHHEEMHWRGMLAIATILPLVLFILAYILLLESPHWLIMNGMVSETRMVVETMVRYKQLDEDSNDFDMAKVQDIVERMNSPKKGHRTEPTTTTFGTMGSPLMVPAADPNSTEASVINMTRLDSSSTRWQRLVAQSRQAEEEDVWRLQSLFSPEFRLTTLIMLYITWVTNFVYIGMIYGLPDTLKKAKLEDDEGWSPAAGMFFSAFFEIPGVFVAIVMSTTLGRRKNMMIAFFGCATALFFTADALVAGKISHTPGVASVFSVKVCLVSGYIIVYLYLLECYPTQFRATGLAFCMVFGRVGGAGALVVYDFLDHFEFHRAWFFVALAIAMSGASIATWFLPYETKDAELSSSAPPGACIADADDLLREDDYARKASPGSEPSAGPRLDLSSGRSRLTPRGSKTASPRLTPPRSPRGDERASAYTSCIASPRDQHLAQSV